MKKVKSKKQPKFREPTPTYQDWLELVGYTLPKHLIGTEFDKRSDDLQEIKNIADKVIEDNF